MIDVQIRNFELQDPDEAVLLWHKSKRKVFPYVQVQQDYTLKDEL